VFRKIDLCDTRKARKHLLKMYGKGEGERKTMPNSLIATAIGLGMAYAAVRVQSIRKRSAEGSDGEHVQLCSLKPAL
jgi:hypothetical protein